MEFQEIAQWQKRAEEFDGRVQFDPNSGIIVWFEGLREKSCRACRQFVRRYHAELSELGGGTQFGAINGTFTIIASVRH